MVIPSPLKDTSALKIFKGYAFFIYLRFINFIDVFVIHRKEIILDTVCFFLSFFSFLLSCFLLLGNCFF